MISSPITSLMFTGYAANVTLELQQSRSNLAIVQLRVIQRPSFISLAFHRNKDILRRNIRSAHTPLRVIITWCPWPWTSGRRFVVNLRLSWMNEQIEREQANRRQRNKTQTWERLMKPKTLKLQLGIFVKTALKKAKTPDIKFKLQNQTKLWKMQMVFRNHEINIFSKPKLLVLC